MFADVKRLNLTQIFLTLLTIFLLLERFPTTLLFFCFDCSAGGYRKNNFFPFVQSHKELSYSESYKVENKGAFCSMETCR